jgi:pSer/pThr/pTyr-binding forkhead associated (FHA) protein
MNYILQVVRGRSETNTLKLMDGVNSVGRHDDCLIRIRSSQVSRRHCELHLDMDKLIVRDLGSSNGTFVNGKRVLGQQALKAGDVLTVGGVTLKIDRAKDSATQAQESPAKTPPKPGDTAVVDAIAIEEEDLGLEEEFEIDIDEEPVHMDIIPLDDEPRPAKPAVASQPAPTPAPSVSRDKPKQDNKATDLAQPPAKTQASPEEEDAVAQFLMDLKLDDED